MLQSDTREMSRDPIGLYKVKSTSLVPRRVSTTFMLDMGAGIEDRLTRSWNDLGQAELSTLQGSEK